MRKGWSIGTYNLGYSDLTLPMATVTVIHVVKFNARAKSYFWVNPWEMSMLDSLAEVKGVRVKDVREVRVVGRLQHSWRSHGN